MSRRKKDPLRLLTDAERNALMQLSRSQVASAVHVSRAIMLLSVAGGSDYQTAARNAGRRSGDAVSHFGGRFELSAQPHVVCDWDLTAQAEEWDEGRHRSRC